MSDVAIRVEGLSKQYRIGARAERYKTLRDTLAGLARVPVRALRRRGRRDGAHQTETFWALNDVSFEVRRGEVIGIIGRNGAGKSTLLKILSRITEPTDGYVDVYGRVGSLLEVGTGFHPELTGRENVYLNGAILGMSRAEIERRFDEIVAFAEVERFIDTPVKHYSSGMYLRLAFAVAAHLEPEILVVDEVLAVGDASFQKKCLCKMQDVGSQGRTVIMVSHNMGAIASLCPTSVLLRNGRLACHGPTGRVIEEYAADASSARVCDIRSRTDRQGSGRARITDLDLITAGGCKTETVLSGERVKFALTYESDDPGPLKNVLFEVKLLDSFGRLLCTLSTFLTGEDFGELPPQGVVSCHVPNLLLGPGVYSTRLTCYVNGTLTDLLDNASSFSVLEHNFLGGGKEVRSQIYGPFLMPHTWIDGPPATI
jgi:lipopolysaccharide transport system ATP-binding protein